MNNKKPTALFTSGLFAILLGLSPMSFANKMSVPVGGQTSQEIQKPKHGQSMQQIESEFGQPIEKSVTVGEPPITSWKYKKFTVYFEHNKVIHSVSHRS